MTAVGRWTRLRVFCRTLAIQGSWNYRTLIGTGFSFALLPALRRLYRSDESRLDDAIGRHAGLFNAHPYLAALAVGAVVRLEAEGEDAAAIERFKLALRGPLGALGDRLIWARWLPLTALAGVIAWSLGAPPWLAVLTFLVPYNVGHLALRIWAFRTGYREGRDVGRALRTADLPGLADRLTLAGCVMLGILFGVLVAGAIRHSANGVFFASALGLGLWLGSQKGAASWRRVMYLTTAAVALVMVWGVIR